MTYVELEINDSIYNKLEKIAEEEGITIEELITDILTDEVSFNSGTDDLIDDDNDGDEEVYSDYDDDN
jgi:hypothetical protein